MIKGVLSAYTQYGFLHFKRFQGSRATLDPAVLKRLDMGYAKLMKSSSKSLLKKHLTQEVFVSLRTKRTSRHSTLLDCVQSGFENLDSKCGVYASEPEAYTVFAELFNPIIEEYHMGFRDTDKQPAFNFGTPWDLEDIDPLMHYVASTRIRCARSINGYPFHPVMTPKHYNEIEDIVSRAVCGMHNEYQGKFYPLFGMKRAVRQKLIDDHILFDEGNRFLRGGNATRFWPNGRGVYFNHDRTFIVWCNEEDHVRVISMQRGGNFGEVFSRLMRGMRILEKDIPFARDDRLGYLTLCPSNLGTTLRASVHIKLPKLATNPKKLKAFASKFKLQLHDIPRGQSRGSGDGIIISNKRRLGITEYEAVKELYCGITEIIKLEKAEKGVAVARKVKKPPQKYSTECIKAPPPKEAEAQLSKSEKKKAVPHSECYVDGERLIDRIAGKEPKLSAAQKRLIKKNTTGKNPKVCVSDKKIITTCPKPKEGASPAAKNAAKPCGLLGKASSCFRNEADKTAADPPQDTPGKKGSLPKLGRAKKEGSPTSTKSASPCSKINLSPRSKTCPTAPKVGEAEARHIEELEKQIRKSCALWAQRSKKDPFGPTPQASPRSAGPQTAQTAAKTPQDGKPKATSRKGCCVPPEKIRIACIRPNRGRVRIKRNFASGPKNSKKPPGLLPENKKCTYPLEIDELSIRKAQDLGRKGCISDPPKQKKMRRRRRVSKWQPKPERKLTPAEQEEFNAMQFKKKGCIPEPKRVKRYDPPDVEAAIRSGMIVRPDVRRRRRAKKSREKKMCVSPSTVCLESEKKKLEAKRLKEEKQKLGKLGMKPGEKAASPVKIDTKMPQKKAASPGKVVCKATPQKKLKKQANKKPAKEAAKKPLKEAAKKPAQQAAKPAAKVAAKKPAEKPPATKPETKKK